MGVLRMAVVVLCALHITSVKCHRPHNSNMQGEKSINNFNNGICTLVDGSKCGRLFRAARRAQQTQFAARPVSVAATASVAVKAFASSITSTLRRLTPSGLGLLPSPLPLAF